MDCKSILVVEDEPALRQTLKDVLEIQGYRVYLAANGKEGIEQLQKIAPEPCVILLDLMMPIMSGWDFLDHQRTNPLFQNIPIVICSAYEESAKAIRPAAYVPKPVKLDQLLGAVKAFCA